MKTFQKGPPLKKAKIKRWWTYLSQFRLIVHHIQGIKNEMADYISPNNFDALLGESSEVFTKEAFQRMDVQLDLSMRTAGLLGGWRPRVSLGAKSATKLQKLPVIYSNIVCCYNAQQRIHLFKSQLIIASKDLIFESNETCIVSFLAMCLRALGYFGSVAFVFLARVAAVVD